MDELLSDFLIETQARLAALDGELTEFVRNSGSSESQGHILELMHTIKGASVLLGLPRLQAIARASEEVIRQARAGAAAITPAVAALILDAILAVRRIQRAIATSGVEPSGDDADLIADLRAAAAGKPIKRSVATEPPPAPVSPESQKPAEPLAPAVPRERAIALAPFAPSVAVPIDRIEHLTSLVGELVLTRNSLNDLLRRRDDTDLEERLQRLSNVTSDLGAGLMTTRRQALGEATGPFEIVQVVSVECASLRYVVPQRSVLELVHVTPSGRPVGSDEVRLLRLRERRYPWVHLATLLKLPPHERLKNARETVVMIETGDTPFGLAVDRVLDIEEIVARPLPPLLRPIALFAGSCILGDGSVALVLSPQALAADLVRARADALTSQVETPRLPAHG